MSRGRDEWGWCSSSDSSKQWSDSQSHRATVSLHAPNCFISILTLSREKQTGLMKIQPFNNYSESCLRVKLKIGIRFVAAWPKLPTWVRISGGGWGTEAFCFGNQSLFPSSVRVVSNTLPTSCSDKETLVEPQDRTGLSYNFPLCRVCVKLLELCV